MANLFAQATANWDAANQWNTVANGSGSFVTPGATDVCMANGKTVTVNISVTVAEVRNDITGGATVGGTFALGSGVTLTANIFGGTSTTAPVSVAVNTPGSSSIVGTYTSGTGTYAINKSGTGILNITGNSLNLVAGGITSGGGTLNITGNITGGSVNHGINVSSTILNVVGNITGGSIANCYGIHMTGPSNATITGDVTGGSGNLAYGINHISTGILIINGIVISNNYPNDGFTAAAPGLNVSFTTVGYAKVNGIKSGTGGVVPIVGYNIFFNAANENSIAMYDDPAGALVTITESATDYPSAANVRDGISYNFTNQTGTLKVPNPASVLYGVQTDNTTGTATLAATDIRSALGMTYPNLDTQLSGIPIAVWSATTRTLSSFGTLVANIWDEILTGATHNIQNSAGKRIRQLTSSFIYEGVAQGAGNGVNQIILDTGASATDEIYVPTMICITSGTGVGQSRLIIRYVGSTRTATVNHQWTVQPDNTSNFTLLAAEGYAVSSEGIAQGGTVNTITLDTHSSSIDNTYVNQTISLISGSGDGEINYITAYNGTTKVATVEHNWITNPTSTTGYLIIPTYNHSPSEISQNVWSYATRDLTTYGTLVSDIATAVWGYVTRTITSGGITAQQVWEYATRTLTSGGGGGATPAEIWSYVTRTLSDKTDYASQTSVTAIADRLAIVPNNAPVLPVPAPVNGKTVCYGVCLDQSGTVEANVVITAKIIKTPSTANGHVYDMADITATSDVNGDFNFTIPKDAGITYRIYRNSTYKFTFTSNGLDNQLLPSFMG